MLAWAAVSSMWNSMTTSCLVARETAAMSLVATSKASLPSTEKERAPPSRDTSPQLRPLSCMSLLVSSTSKCEAQSSLTVAMSVPERPLRRSASAPLRRTATTMPLGVRV